MNVQETKPKKTIGIIRAYNHEFLLAFLKRRDIALSTFKKLNIHERSSLLLNAPIGLIQYEQTFENITPIVGFTLITKALTGNVASLSELEVNVHAFGSGTTLPADANTKLETEVFRKQLASVSQNGNKAYYTAFYEQNEANGTHTEMGLFCGANPATADDGTLWDRTMNSITKDASQTLTIDYEDTFLNDV